MTTETMTGELDALAANLAVHVRRRCGLAYATWREHLADLKQEGLVQLLAHADRPRGYGVRAAINAMLHYVLVTIRNLQGGWYLSAGDIDGFYTVYIEELGRADDDTPLEEWWLPTEDFRCGIPRPVERQVVRREAEAGETGRWVQAEQELLDILIGMKQGQWHPEALALAAQILVRSGHGMSHHAIGQELGLDGKQVHAIREHYRQALADYLEQGALTQGLIAARGGSSYYRFEELTEAVINAGRKLLVAFPHGIFALTTYTRSGRTYLRFQGGRRVGGKCYNRTVQLGQVGTVTRAAVWEGSLTFKERMAALPAGEG